MEHDHHHMAPDLPAGTGTAHDPVCGMTVAITPETRREDFRGRTFHFCSDKCRDDYKAKHP